MNESLKTEIAGDEGKQGRRELVEKLGKFTLYAAPFTVFAASSKASAATGMTPRGPRRRG